MAAETVLILSSQQQLLERLLHLSRLEQGLVLLSGPPGAGKRTLAGLLVQQAGLPAAATLDARLLTSQAAFRDALLSDWFSDVIFDPDDHLLESVTRLLPAAPGRRLLVVENGQWLTDPQLQELAELCLGAAGGAGVPLYCCWARRPGPVACAACCATSPICRCWSLKFPS
ncbi:ATP-binding protein [Oceanimonas sp. NS1]|nr:ATP-binding protein [Oceanimonas sp. NS1]